MTDEHEDPAGDAGEEVVEDSAGEGVDRSEDRVDEPLPELCAGDQRVGADDVVRDRDLQLSRQTCCAVTAALRDEVA